MFHVKDMYTEMLLIDKSKGKVKTRKFHIANGTDNIHMYIIIKTVRLETSAMTLTSYNDGGLNQVVLHAKPVHVPLLLW